MCPELSVATLYAQTDLVWAQLSWFLCKAYRRAWLTEASVSVWTNVDQARIGPWTKLGLVRAGPSRDSATLVGALLAHSSIDI